MNIISFFSSRSEQGIAGLCALKPYNPLDNKQYAFKLSKYPDTVIENECRIMDTLHELPNYLRKVKEFHVKVTRKFLRSPSKENFHPKPKEETFSRLVVIMEYIPDEDAHAWMSNTTSIAAHTSFTIQSLYALLNAQQLCKFTHYDIHLGNIFAKSVDNNTIQVLKGVNNENILIPTFGKIPIIFDFGNSYAEIALTKHTPFFNSIHFYQYGFVSGIPDRIFDIHRLLENVFSTSSTDLYKYYAILMNDFVDMNICKRTGWKELPTFDICENVFKLIEANCNKDITNIFGDHITLGPFLDLFTRMIPIVGSDINEDAPDFSLNINLLFETLKNECKINYHHLQEEIFLEKLNIIIINIMSGKQDIYSDNLILSIQSIALELGKVYRRVHELYIQNVQSRYPDYISFQRTILLLIQNITPAFTYIANTEYEFLLGSNSTRKLILTSEQVKEMNELPFIHKSKVIAHLLN
jgi:hypothetical protein